MKKAHYQINITSYRDIESKDKKTLSSLSSILRYIQFINQDNGDL